MRDFQTDVIEASRERPVLVDFWAPWCGPCRVLGPVLEKLAGESEGRWTLAKLNTDENGAVATRYKISSIPAVKLFVDGQVAKEFVGALPEARVRAWLDEALPSQAAKLAAEAQSALDAGDATGAEALARDALATDANNADAKLLVARLTVFSDPAAAETLAREAAATRAALLPQAQALEAVARLVRQAVEPQALPDGPGREAYVWALDALAGGDSDAAASRLIDVLRTDRRYGDDAARKAGVALFAVLGDRHPVTQKHRRAFDRAVF